MSNSFVQFSVAHILVVDNSPVNRVVVIEALKRALTKLFYRVI